MRQQNEFDQRTKWMRSSDAMNVTRQWLLSFDFNGSDADVRTLIAFLYMDVEADFIFTSSSADVIMRRETRTVVRQFDALLLDTGAFEQRLLFANAYDRARRFFTAWSAHDRRQMTEHITAIIVACKTPNDAPDADLLEHLHNVGGEQAVRRARAEHEAHAPVARENIVEHVTRTARRAFWDVLRSSLVEGNYEHLYGVLQEMADGMRALVAHSVRSIDDLNDTFDVAWLRQQVEADCLTTQDVRGLIMHLARTISSWQAPVDAAEAHAWVDDIESRANVETDLETFVNGFLVDFLAEAHERLGTIYMRILSFEPNLLEEQD